MGHTVTQEEMDSLKRRAALVSKIWDAIIAATEGSGEMTGPEILWALTSISGRVIVMELKKEGGA